MLNYVNRSGSITYTKFLTARSGCAAIFATYLSLRERGVRRGLRLGTPYGSSATP